MFNGVGRVYQQTQAKVGFTKLCDRKTPQTAADLLNDRVMIILFSEEHDTPLERVLTDRGTEYCGTHDRARQPDGRGANAHNRQARCAEQRNPG
jgi:hypothetical protein